MNSIRASLQAIEHELSDAARDRSTAEYQFECLKNMVTEYERNLDDDHEIAIVLTSFGESVTMLVCEVCYIDPVLIVFKGFVDEKWSTLIQHVTQLNVLLTTVTKQDPLKPPRRIGFDTNW